MTARAGLQIIPQRAGETLVSPRDLRQLDLAPRLKLIALAAVASVILHLGAMAALAPRERVLIAGGGTDAPAALGTSFADFAKGVLSPSRAMPLDTDQMAPMLPDVPRQSLVSEAPSQPDHAAPMAADRSAALLPATPDPTQTSRLPEIVPDRSGPQLGIAPQDHAQPYLPEPAAIAPTERIAAASPKTLRPDTSPTDYAPATSRKPLPRPDRRARAPTPRQAPASQGNAAQTVPRGSQQGSTAQAASPAPARAQNPNAQGNAAASNYPGEVLRRIQRTRQARSPARGLVLVSFTVGYNGGLASVVVARSSGHSGLDQTALDHIRRAAPFPPPPAGAQRQFSFEFVGR